MPLTAEERKQRAEARAEARKRWREEEERLRIEFPDGRLIQESDDDEGYLAIVAEAGDRVSLKVIWRGSPWETDEFEFANPVANDIFQAEKRIQSEEEQSAEILYKPNLQQLGEFIRALITRYNAMVKEMNDTVAATPPMELAENLEQHANLTPVANRTKSCSSTDSSARS
jgi:hypothetical protein